MEISKLINILKNFETQWGGDTLVRLSTGRRITEKDIMIEIDCFGEVGDGHYDEIPYLEIDIEQEVTHNLSKMKAILYGLGKEYEKGKVIYLREKEEPKLLNDGKPRPNEVWRKFQEWWEVNK